MRGLRLPQPPNASDDLYQLMLNCWQIDLDERPNFDEILQVLHDMDGVSKNYRVLHQSLQQYCITYNLIDHPVEEINFKIELLTPTLLFFRHPSSTTPSLPVMNTHTFRTTSNLWTTPNLR